MGNILQVTDENFESEVIKSDKLTIVDFWAEWCAPCRMVAPVLEDIANEYDGQIKITKLNVDENSKTPSDYRITSIPTLFFYKDGQIIDQVVGALPKHLLVEKIKPHL